MWDRRVDAVRFEVERVGGFRVSGFGLTALGSSGFGFIAIWYRCFLGRTGWDDHKTLGSWDVVWGEISLKPSHSNINRVFLHFLSNVFFLLIRRRVK